MKIAIIYDAVYPYIKGGGEKRVYELAKALSKRHEIHLFGMKYWKGPKILKYDNIHIHGVCKAVPLYNKKGNRSLYQPIYFSWYLFKDLLKYNFDIIDCQNIPYLPCFIAKFYSIIKNKPLVVTWLELYNWKEINLGFIGKLIENLCFRLTKNNIAVSRNIAEQIRNKPVIIPCGIDISKIKKVKKSRIKFDILFVGRLVKGKNINLLLHSVENLNLKIGIIGDGPEKHRLMKNANNSIRFLGFMKEDREVYSYMKSSKILVLPSFREGFGIVVLEALAAGCKVITMDSKYNAAMELVDPNFICSASNLRKKIIECLTKKYRNKINLYDYDSNKIANKLEQFYKRCING